MHLIWIGVLLLILSIFIKKNKFLYLAQILFMVLVAANNNMNADYVNYLNGYRYMFNYHGLISEPIFWLLARTSNIIGLDFLGYRYIFFGIAFILLGYVIWKLAEFPNIILGFYFLYPFSMDVIQMRSLMANALVLFAILKLQNYINSKNIRDIIISIVLVAVATGFHFFAAASAIMYLALISEKTFKRYLPRFLALGIVVLLALAAFGSRINAKLTELGIIEKVASYQEGDSKIGGYLLSVLILRVMFIMICWLAMHVPSADDGFEGKDTLRSNNQFQFRCICLLSLYVFLELFVSMEIERISRVNLILGYILMTNTKLITERNNHRIIKCFIYAFVIGYFYIMYFRHFAESSNWFEYAFKPIFENNLLN